MSFDTTKPHCVNKSVLPLQNEMRYSANLQIHNRTTILKFESTHLVKNNIFFNLWQKEFMDDQFSSQPPSGLWQKTAETASHGANNQQVFQCPFEIIGLVSGLLRQG